MKCRLFLLCLLSVLSACSESGNESGQTAAKASEKIQAGSYDFGEVCIDAGAMTVEHTFDFKNVSKRELEVIAVSTTCGCTKASMNPKVLAPGDTGQLSIKIEIGNVGVVEQSATALLKDGRVLRFTGRALGTRTTRHTLIPERTRIESNQSRVELQLYLVDRRGVPEVGVPKVLFHGKPLDVSFHDWDTFEQYDPAASRPLRQSATIEFSAADLQDEFPAILQIETSSGLKSKMTVDLFPSNS